jgi:DHA1 family bicyclomycin/chloramphenicol resistance-like MFS transporter
MNQNNIKRLSTAEFVTIMAALMALLALSVDSMLPAMEIIGRDLNVADVNHTSAIISMIFLGLAIGMPVYGIASDSIGRKPIIIIGIFIFIIGSVLAIIAENFTVMLIARFIQGFGVAGPRTICQAMTRDLYSGREMAKISSFIMMIFILAPALAPLIGQGVLLFADWHSIFILLIIYGVVVSSWIMVRQPETLAKQDRRIASISLIFSATKEILANRQVMGNLLATAMCSAGLFIYLNMSQQIFVGIYNLGVYFPFYFGVVALISAVATFANGKLVMRLGMRFLATLAATLLIASSVIFLLSTWFFNGIPPLMYFLLFATACFISIGFLFGNLSALAMEPVGHIAGIAAAIIGSLGTLIAIPFSFLISANFNNTLYPLALGFLLFSSATLFFIKWGNKSFPSQSAI